MSGIELSMNIPHLQSDVARQNPQIRVRNLGVPLLDRLQERPRKLESCENTVFFINVTSI